MRMVRVSPTQASHSWPEQVSLHYITSPARPPTRNFTTILLCYTTILLPPDHTHRPSLPRSGDSQQRVRPTNFVPSPLVPVPLVCVPCGCSPVLLLSRATLLALLGLRIRLAMKAALQTQQ